MLTYSGYLQSLEVVGWSKNVPIQFDWLVDASSFLLLTAQPKELGQQREIPFEQTAVETTYIFAWWISTFC